MIAGGGTGGHIYPAIAIGRAMQKIDPNVVIRFVGTAAGLESKIMQRENLSLDLIQSGKLNFSGSPLQKIITLLKILVGVFQSLGLIVKHRPDFVLGVGGYASAPFVMMASMLGRKTAIWEPNAHPGMANRVLSRFVKSAYLVFVDSKKYLFSSDNKVFGMPLREEIEEEIERTGAEKRENSKISDRLTILCFGGSQGSVFLNEKISDFMIKNSDLHEKIYLIHQTGASDFEKIKNKYKTLLSRFNGEFSPVEVHEFIYDMANQYRKADIQVCRGGASTIAEAAAFGVIPLIIPLPAADDHQLKNAEVIVKNQAGFLFKQNQFDEIDFTKTVRLMLSDSLLRKNMQMNLKKLAPKHAASEIAHDILRQIRSNY